LGQSSSRRITLAGSKTINSAVRRTSAIHSDSAMKRCVICIHTGARRRTFITPAHACTKVKMMTAIASLRTNNAGPLLKTTTATATRKDLSSTATTGYNTRRRTKMCVDDERSSCTPWERERTAMSVSPSSAMAPIMLIVKKTGGANISDWQTGCSTVVSPQLSGAPTNQAVSRDRRQQDHRIGQVNRKVVRAIR